MRLTFFSSRDSRADDPNDISTPLRETYEQQLIKDRVPDDYFSDLFRRMFVIVENLREMIGENGACLIESNLVLLQVGFRFVVVPLKLDTH